MLMHADDVGQLVSPGAMPPGVDKTVAVDAI